MSLQDEQNYYETRREEFERDHNMEWIIIRDRKVLGIYKNFHHAADRYEFEYDGRPMMLKQIGFVPQPQKFEFAVASPD